MRTTLDIDDGLLAALLARLPDKSKTEAIEAAISEFLAADAKERLRQLRGKIEIEDVSKTLRGEDRHT